jgi:hypothetical protein
MFIWVVSGPFQAAIPSCKLNGKLIARPMRGQAARGTRALRRTRSGFCRARYFASTQRSLDGLLAISPFHFAEYVSRYFLAALPT